ncbi:hypothetical protein ACJMK2_034294, partial [Sinanodonta woodiana]
SVLLDITITGISVTRAQQGHTKHLLVIKIVISAALELIAHQLDRYHLRSVKLENIRMNRENGGVNIVIMCVLGEHSDQIKVKLARNVPLACINQHIIKLYVFPAKLVHIRIKQARHRACNVYREVIRHSLDLRRVSNAVLDSTNHFWIIQSVFSLSNWNLSGFSWCRVVQQMPCRDFPKPNRSNELYAVSQRETSIIRGDK